MQELLRLPAVSAEVVAGFEAAMMGTRSEKDQRNLIRRLLFNSGTGPNSDKRFSMMPSDMHTHQSLPQVVCTAFARVPQRRHDIVQMLCAQDNFLLEAEGFRTALLSTCTNLVHYILVSTCRGGTFCVSGAMAVRGSLERCCLCNLKILLRLCIHWGMCV